MSHSALGPQFGEVLGVPVTTGISMPDVEFHGTEEAAVHSIVDRQMADRRGIQVYGPGFYTTDNPEVASHHAVGRGRMTRREPAVLAGYTEAKNPVSVDQDALAEIGRRWREANPHIENTSWANADDHTLGNIALRQAGHDYMHIEGQSGSVGVVLRPGRFQVDEIGDEHSYTR